MSKTTALVPSRWHADPWWNDLAPWLKKELHWPHPSLLALWEIPSYTDGSVKGKQAPPLISAEWINGRNPGAWDRPGRKVTLVYFYGGRLINPHPKWVNAVRELLRQFGPQGTGCHRDCHARYTRADEAGCARACVAVSGCHRRKRRLLWKDTCGVRTEVVCRHRDG